MSLVRIVPLTLDCMGVESEEEEDEEEEEEEEEDTSPNCMEESDMSVSRWIHAYVDSLDMWLLLL